MLGSLKGIVQEVLDFRYLLQYIMNLEALYICNDSDLRFFSKWNANRTLNNSSHFVIFAEVDQLFIGGQWGRPV